MPGSLLETRCHSGEQNRQFPAQGELTVWCGGAGGKQTDK